MQATFRIPDDGDLVLLDDQPSLKLEGEWYGDPASSSLRIEPQTAFMKPATDVILHGHAYAASPQTAEVLVGIRIGSLSKVARVVGDRFLVRRGGTQRIAGPSPFETIPLVYERAFGGWDRREPDAMQHRCEPRRPVGLGYRAHALAPDDEVPLPNIELPGDPLREYGDAPAPAGFGFVAPHWLPRATFAGTYDTAWMRSRSPLLPGDFDRRFFNAASPGLIAPSYLKGDEPAVVVGATPGGRIASICQGSCPNASSNCVAAGESR